MVDATVRDDRPPTTLESVLRHDRAPAVVLLIVLPLVSWLWIVVMARDMYGPMTGASAWMMTAVWDVRHLALLWAMWAVMMVGMMLPPASPMLLLYGGVARRSATDPSAASRQIYALAAGYLVVWALFSLAATGLQRVLAMLLFVSSMMEVTSPVLGAALLLIAGVYQLTPLKLACLRTCQSPLGFLMSRWRAGLAGAFRMGLEHGALCVGCCWALMLLLFAGGVMNLSVIAALTVLVAFEKLTPFGAHGARISGILLIAAALWMLYPSIGGVMADIPKWRVQGDWFDTCNCSIPCPCTFAQPPTSGDCEGILAWHIRTGTYGDVRLDGLSVMALGAFKGNLWEGQTKASLAMFMDERANEYQRDALQMIFSGRVGGWPGIFAKTIGEVRGMEFARIDFHVDDDLASWRAEIPGKLKSGAEALGGPTTPPGKRVQVHNAGGSETGPGGVATYGKSTADKADAFGFKWDRSGRSSKHIGFDWSGPDA